jgi:ribosomal protein L29
MSESNGHAVEPTAETLGHDDLLKAVIAQGLAEAPESENPDDGALAPSPAEATTAKAEAEPAAKPETTNADAEKTAREAKSEERAQKTWQEINEEKAKLAEERKQLEAAKRQSTHQPEDYDALAKTFEDEGRDDLAKVARDRAAQLRADAEQAKVNGERQAFEQARLKVIKETVEQNPDLNQPESELFKATEAFLKRRPTFLRTPEGFADAVETVKATLNGSKASELEKQVAELKQKLADYESKLQPGVGSPSSASRSVNFDNLPVAEQKSRLVAELRAAEQAGTFSL